MIVFYSFLVVLQYLVFGFAYASYSVYECRRHPERYETRIDDGKVFILLVLTWFPLALGDMIVGAVVAVWTSLVSVIGVPADRYVKTIIRFYDKNHGDGA